MSNQESRKTILAESGEARTLRVTVLLADMDSSAREREKIMITENLDPVKRFKFQNHCEAFEQNDLL